MRTVTPTTVDVGNIQDALGINPLIRMLSYNADPYMQFCINTQLTSQESNIIVCQ